MRYVADDGVEFETEKECLEHECLLADIESSFIMYDEDLNKLPLKDCEDCWYVHVLRRATDVGDYLYSNLGLGVDCNDITKDDLYYYDNDGRFRSVNSLFCYHQAQARKFQQIREKLLASDDKCDD